MVTGSRSQIGNGTSEDRCSGGLVMVLAAARNQIQPHDLLRLRSAALLARAAPKWVSESPARSSWVVARYRTTPDGLLAVGVRGSQRNQRWDTMILPTDIGLRVTPEQLVYRIGHLDNTSPAAEALRQLRRRLHGLALRWGPIGSAGFELASGLVTMDRDSDLDIVVRFGRPAPRQLVDSLQSVVQNLPAIVDVQLDLGFGAVSLAELMSPKSKILARTRSGERLMPTELCWLRA